MFGTSSYPSLLDRTSENATFIAPSHYTPDFWKHFSVLIHFFCLLNQSWKNGHTDPHIGMLTHSSLSLFIANVAVTHHAWQMQISVHTLAWHSRGHICCGTWSLLWPKIDRTYRAADRPNRAVIHQNHQWWLKTSHYWFQNNISVLKFIWHASKFELQVSVVHECKTEH